MEIKNIVKNVAPAIVVMIVGLGGAYFVYNNYFSTKAATEASAIEPATGEEAAAPAEAVVESTEGAATEAAPAADAGAAATDAASAEEVIPEGCVKAEDGRIVKADDATVVCEVPAPAAEGTEGAAPVEGDAATPAAEGAPTEAAPEADKAAE